MSSEIAIKVESLSKCYQIYEKPHDRLKQYLLPRLQRAAGLPTKQFYREFWALKDVSFEIRKGETVGIIGRNGSGKSTLLQMICGTLSPTSGSIATHGRIAALLELGAGFNSEFTGRDNVYLSASLYGLTRDQIDERFDKIAAFADIGHFIDQPVKTYSSGMFVRLAFAVIANVDADILIIDEALAVGDAYFVQKCMRFLRNFAERGTLIFVSHDIGAVLNLCKSAFWLQQGVLRSAGTPKALINEYMQALYEEDSEPAAEKLLNRPTLSISEHQDGDNASHLAAKPTAGKISAPQEWKAQTSNSKPINASLPRDMRQDLFNASNLRTDIEVFSFKQDADSFGNNAAKIVDVRFEDHHERQLSWIVGGEDLRLSVDCDCAETINGPIIGFIVKDRLGQVLFGDNTYLTTSENPLSVPPNQRITAVFEFTMPRLPNGDYTISVAVAEGTQAEHVQHHWVHDALTFKVHTSSVYSGLVGIPMARIELSIKAYA
ncbi:ABC transporter ATP-binding protein [Aquipseudomonas alcaligenes]|uniref:ABC transporter ATP-binding protein n=1 Tax=Aquipseudomonas alcaligenes TaxID=43263 RepID=UPI00242F8D09|nr:ABC transporter ATP-binding protein [Pseudomonas alcaligenes]